MRKTNLGVTVDNGDDDRAFIMVPKAEKIHFDYSTVPKATRSNLHNGFMLIIKNFHTTTSLNEWKAARKINNAKAADVIGKSK